MDIHGFHRSQITLVGTILLFLLGGPGHLPVSAASADRQEGDLRVGYHSETGKAIFIGAPRSRPLEIASIAGRAISANELGVEYADYFGDLLGLRDASQELTVLRGRDQEGGRRSTRYQQVFHGIPILAGELIVNLDAQGRLLSISGEISPDLEVSTAPEISAAKARESALGAIAKAYGISESGLSAAAPELWIFDERLLRPSERPAQLVWRTEVTASGSQPIRELVLIDALGGGVTLHFNQIDTTWSAEAASLAHSAATPSSELLSPPGSPLYIPGGNRSTYTANNGTSLPGTLLCTQATAICTAGANPHADAAHNYAADTYDFYFDNHGRDSINAAGMTIVSTVHYDVDYFNAFWSGTQMVYGDGAGFPLADDVVAHELTHGVTQYETNLFYYYQSGAMNESFSDIWGEFVDQVNGAGNDSAGVKWLMGEDVAGMGAIRDMADPPAFGHPDRVKSALYLTDSGDSFDPFHDNGGVHTNSGVGNKAAYLITDGGSFNGYTITGLGISKAAAIYYEGQTGLLTSGADYRDLYFALDQACQNLIGGAEGITSGNCTEVVEATEATELSKQPTSGFNPHAQICPAGFVANDLFFDDFESGGANWATGTLVGSNAWFLGDFFATSGTDSLWGDDSVYDFGVLGNDSFVRMAMDVALPGGSQPYLHFNHAFGFEDPDWDGGWLEYSTNGGGSWTDAGSLQDSGVDYNSTISSGWDNPNAGHAAFVSDSHGYVSSRYDLSSLAGGNVRFRFRMSVDSLFNDLGWFVDDVRIFTCVIPAPSVPSNVQASDGTYGSRVQVNWDAVGDATYYEVYRDTDAGGGTMGLLASPASASYSDTAVSDLVTYYYWVKACNTGGCSGLSTADSGYADASASTEIFSDGFESGDTSAWSNTNTGGGDLTVCPAGAMNGTSFGLCIAFTTDKRKQVVDATPADETHYRARFYFDPNGLSLGNNQKIRLAQARTGVNLVRPVIVLVRVFNGEYQIRARGQDDLMAGYYDTGWYTISDGPHVIEVDWQAASGPGANDGTLALYLDDVLRETLSAMDTDAEVVTTITLGFTSKTEGVTVSGSMYLDEFASDSDAYIGP
jgi:Zn-dependent metalloprotease